VDRNVAVGTNALPTPLHHSQRRSRTVQLARRSVGSRSLIRCSDETAVEVERVVTGIVIAFLVIFKDGYATQP